MNKLLITLMAIASISAFAEDSKIICATPISYIHSASKALEVVEDLNQLIKDAKKEGFEKVSAPSAINTHNYGATAAICVTVTKP